MFNGNIDQEGRPKRAARAAMAAIHVAMAIIGIHV